MRKLLLFLYFVFLTFLSEGQGPPYQWAKGLNGPYRDYGNSVAVDGSGCIYITGSFNGPVDFDPGPGIFSLTSVGGDDIFIQKLDPLGNFVWVKTMGGSNNDAGNCIAVDNSGNIFVTGYFNGTADFDPGIGIFSMSTVGNYAGIFISKIDFFGNFIWSKSVSGSGVALIDSQGASIFPDSFGNVYCSGIFSGLSDFDPGPGTFTLTHVTGSAEHFILKLNSSGDLLWVKKVGGQAGANNDGVLSLDLYGHVYLTGSCNGLVDLDPGPGTFTLTGGIFVLKLDTSGSFIWAKTIAANVGGKVRAITIDIFGNIYTTGHFQGVGDFDPGPGTFTLAFQGVWGDIFISKIDSSGNFIWAKGMGASSHDCGNSIISDTLGNIYTTGIFMHVVDFDPGPGTFTLSSEGNSSTFILKLNYSGNFVWVETIYGSSGSSIKIDGSDNIYTVGYFSGTTDFDPGPGIFNMTSMGWEDIFIHKINQCSALSANNPTICVGQSCTLTANGANSYTWNPGPASNSMVVSPAVSSIYTVTAIGINNCINVLNATVTVNSTPTINIISNPGLICSGQNSTLTANGANTYSWNTGSSSSSIVVSPTNNIFFTVTGINYGCPVDTKTISISVIPSPTLVVNSTSTLLCNGSSASLTANGATNYLWNTGATTASISVSPTVTTMYTVTGVNPNGCYNSQTITIIVNLCAKISQINLSEINNIKIYPNPLTGILNIEMDAMNKEILTVQLTNTLGQIVLNKKTNNPHSSFDLSHLPTGIYFLNLQQNSSIKTLKIIKE